MGQRFSAAWTGFARTGVPDSPLTPRSTPFDTRTRATMVFDTETRIVNDHRREFRLLWEEWGGGGFPG
jgi:para-nitrobenzyl esterase